MDIIHFIADTITAALKHGWSLTTFILVIVALFRIQIIQNMLLRRLPRRFRNKDRLEIVERKIDVIAAHMGVKEWDADSKIGKIERSVTTGAHKKSLSPLAGYAHAIIARYFTRSKETYHLSQRRMSMKSKLLSRKFLMAVISAALVIANDGLSLGLDQNTIIAFGTIVVGWIIGESAVDARRKTVEVTDAYTTSKDAGDV
jgi:hypothetical protein